MNLNHTQFFIITTTILTNKTTIFLTIITILILRHLLKTLHRHHQFPVFTAKQTALYCAVCLYDIDRGQRYRRLPHCKHCFHLNCIDTWLQLRSTCPLCRNQIPAHLLPRKKDKKPGFLYLFFYFAVKAIRKRIESKFSKMMVLDED